MPETNITKSAPNRGKRILAKSVDELTMILASLWEYSAGVKTGADGLKK
jgi:hypothetical protein